MTKVKVVDSIMGSGKSTWATNYMNAHRDRRFIFCTPFRKEVERIMAACPHFSTPEEKDGIPKQADFIQMLENGECIVTTHELFKRLPVTPRITERLKEYGYTLILDEVLEIIEKINIEPKDMKALFNERYVEVDELTGTVRWIEKDYSPGGVFSGYKRLIDTKAVIRYKDNLLLWLFPKELLKAFSEIYELTFMFTGSTTEQYLRICGFEIEPYYVDDGQLVSGIQNLSPEKEKIRELLDIYDGPLNTVGDKWTAFSSNWWKRRGNSDKKRAINDAYNFLHNVCRARVGDILWSRIKEKPNEEPSIKGKLKNAFCPCNARATNEYKDRTVLVYLANIFIDPGINAWFEENGGHIDAEQHALSQLLQWVWRSGIREHKPVRLYLPSRRMREMLTAWLTQERG